MFTFAISRYNHVNISDTSMRRRLSLILNRHYHQFVHDKTKGEGERLIYDSMLVVDEEETSLIKLDKEPEETETKSGSVHRAGNWSIIWLIDADEDQDEWTAVKNCFTRQRWLLFFVWTIELIFLSPRSVGVRDVMINNILSSSRTLIISSLLTLFSSFSSVWPSLFHHLDTSSVCILSCLALTRSSAHIVY